MTVNVLIAPSGFKESLSPEEVADCIEEGVLSVLPDANIQKMALVDGGEGFTNKLVDLTGGTLSKVRVTGPVGKPVEACFGILGGSGPRTAVIEMASAAGLRLVPESVRNPLATTTYGVGELIKAALDEGVERLLIGCADSGTNDGGAGMAQALGIALLDAEGKPIGKGGAELLKLARIDLSGKDARLDRVKINVACNFNSLLCGPTAVSRVFGPQKGASPMAVELLVNALEHYAGVIEKHLGIDVRTLPGGGAAGGLGAGLHAFLNASLHHRYEVVRQYLDFDTPVSKADLVITGEGCIDFSTPLGKIPCEIGRRAKTLGIPVLAVVGMVGRGAELALDHGIDSFASVLDAPMQLSAAICQAPDLVKKGTANLMRTVLIGKRLAEAESLNEEYVAEHMMQETSRDSQPQVVVPLLLDQFMRDLRTPFNLVIAYSKMVKDGQLGSINPAQEQALRQVIKHSYWLLTMLNGLMRSVASGGIGPPVESTGELVSETKTPENSKLDGESGTTMISRA